MVRGVFSRNGIPLQERRQPRLIGAHWNNRGWRRSHDEVWPEAGIPDFDWRLRLPVSNGEGKSMNAPEKKDPYLLFMLVLSILSLLGLAISTSGRLDKDQVAVLETADTFVCALFFVDFLV